MAEPRSRAALPAGPELSARAPAPHPARPGPRPPRRPAPPRRPRPHRSGTREQRRRRLGRTFCARRAPRRRPAATPPGSPSDVVVMETPSLRGRLFKGPERLPASGAPSPGPARRVQSGGLPGGGGAASRSQAEDEDASARRRSRALHRGNRGLERRRPVPPRGPASRPPAPGLAFRVPPGWPSRRPPPARHTPPCSLEVRPRLPGCVTSEGPLARSVRRVVGHKVPPQAPDTCGTWSPLGSPRAEESASPWEGRSPAGPGPSRQRGETPSSGAPGRSGHAGPAASSPRSDPHPASPQPPPPADTLRGDAAVAPWRPFSSRRPRGTRFPAPRAGKAGARGGHTSPGAWAPHPRPRPPRSLRGPPGLPRAHAIGASGPSRPPTPAFPAPPGSLQQRGPGFLPPTRSALLQPPGPPGPAPPSLGSPVGPAPSFAPVFSPRHDFPAAPQALRPSHATPAPCAPGGCTRRLLPCTPALCPWNPAVGTAGSAASPVGPAQARPPTLDSFPPAAPQDISTPRKRDFTESPCPKAAPPRSSFLQIAEQLSRPHPASRAAPPLCSDRVPQPPSRAPPGCPLWSLLPAVPSLDSGHFLADSLLPTPPGAQGCCKASSDSVLSAATCLGAHVTQSDKVTMAGRPLGSATLAPAPGPPDTPAPGPLKERGPAWDTVSAKILRAPTPQAQGVAQTPPAREAP
ncbi:basic proline-rich protein-like [Choloepus didactylus]|uniref:basic proline-rich protein-like n=1 Tax=Choloepus didactylus TaxID=27675 RepID=UPI00189ED93E|nr:basic proline-rich protein-like [Choloepus didactylus]